MAYYYLSNLSTTYDFDDNVFTIDLGMPKRNWKIDNNAGSHGGILRNQGLYEHRVINVELKFKGTGATTFAATRNNFLKWINKAHYQPLYFYVLHADGSTTTRTQCYPSPASSEKYKYIKVSENVNFDFFCPNPFFENVSSDTGTLAITGATEQTQAVTNDGNIDCPVRCKFTPTAAQTFFQVKLAEDYGFRLEGNFSSGVQVVYDTSDGSMTIGGVEVLASQYLTSGSVFNIVPGSNNLYVTCSGAGTFGWGFAERYI
jgi:hypothetical protein